MEEKKPEEPKELSGRQKSDKPIDTKKEIETLEEAEEELNELEKFEITPEQKQEIQELKEIPKGKKICPICNKLQNTRGFNNHLEACKRKQEEKEATSKYGINDQLAPATTPQEKKDINEAQRITNQYQQQMQPLAERQDLRNEVAVEQLETQRQNLINKREGADDISFKDLISLKKLEMLGEKKSGGNSEFIALMNSQTQSNQNMFQMMMQTQKDAHQRDLQNQTNQFNFMVQQLQKDKDEGSVFSKIKEVSESAKLLGLEKKEEGSMDKVAEVIGNNISKLPEVLKTIKELREPPVNTYSQIPPPAPVISNPGEEEKISSVLEPMATSPQEDGVEPNVTALSSVPSQPPPAQPTIANPHISDAQYSKENDLSDYGYDKSEFDANDILAQSLGGNRFKVAQKKYV